MQPHARFTALFWAVGGLIDEGYTEDVDSIQAHIGDASLFEYLSQKYPGLDLSLLSNDDRAALLRFFRALADTVDHGRKFGVRRNGLLLLIAYSMEGIQQVVDASHEPNV